MSASRLFVALLLSAVLLGVVQLCSSRLVFAVDSNAETVRVNVYAVCLGGVGAGWVDNVSRVVDGVSWGCRAVDAIQYWNGKWELAGQSSWSVFDRVPINVSVTLITDWVAYRVLVEYASDVIIVNCHGEVLPIPSGYNETEWVDVVADAMLTRRVSWVHVGGYPFYRVWYQGASGSVEWPVNGTLGFKSLMAHINLPDVECWPAVNEHERISMHPDARELLLKSWVDIGNAFSVENGRPLKNSDFGDYFVMRVHGGVEYFSCAVVAFAKPNQRFNVTEEYGFGAYVHVGTNQTYNGAGAPTDKDYWRGYVGAAAATWTEMQAFHGADAKAGDLNISPFAQMALFARPVVTSYYWDSQSNSYFARVSFFIYGCLKILEGTYTFIDDVDVLVDSLAPNCQVKLAKDVSRNGNGSGLVLEGIDAGDGAMPIAGTFLFALSVVAIACPPAWPLYAVTLPLGGLKLYSDWLSFFADNPVRGVDDYDSRVEFTYNPTVTETNIGDGYLYDEFQSLVSVEVKIPSLDRPQWSIVPLKWKIRVNTFPGLSGPTPSVAGGASLAVRNTCDYDQPFRASVFFEDFEDGLESWVADDSNSVAGQDYWGAYDAKTGLCTDQVHSAWCAQVGNHSIDGLPNEEVTKYDKGMNASLTRQLDLRPYRSPAELSYYLEAIIKQGDYFVVEYCDTGWHELRRHNASGQNYYNESSISLPNTMIQLRFRFVSNDDDDVDVGVFLDNVEVKDVIPNDAGTNVDAGDQFSQATFIETSEATRNYAGYLNDDDCYNFSVNRLQRIYVSLHYPLETSYAVTLYDPLGNQKVTSTTSFGYTANLEGGWVIKINSSCGFGQYDFDIIVYDVPSGGGGCPYLYVYNGSDYICEGLLDIHEPNGTDIVRNHTLMTIPKAVCGSYRLRLVEHPQTRSSIDQVKLYAILEDNSTLRLPLVWAWHSEDGFVLPRLLFSDDWKTETLGADWNNGTSQSINLKFLALPPDVNARGFIFQIEGNNPVYKR